jgi:hypothetical protein
VHKDVCPTFVRFDETEALIGIEKLYSASLGHASGPFLSAHHPHGQHYFSCPCGRLQAVLEI